MGRVVLVTGVSRDFGGRFARRIAADPAVDRVIGVDVVPPRGDLGEVRFVRADIRNPVIAKVIAGQDVDTVAHLSILDSAGAGGSRTAMKEHNVIGTMQLLAACQKAPCVERLVVLSSTAVYGSSSRDPAMFTEDMAAKRMPRAGFAKDVLEVEGYVRGFARRRPDVSVTMLRAADVVGPTVDTPLTRYFRLPVVPTVLGFDARLQLLHADDLMDALRQATVLGRHGTVNLAGSGVLMVSQALRRLGRPRVPAPSFALGSVGSVARQAGARVSLSPDLVDYLTFGRGVETTRMRSLLEFEPAYTTSGAFDDFARHVNPDAHLTRTTPEWVPQAVGGGHG